MSHQVKQRFNIRSRDKHHCKLNCFNMLPDDATDIKKASLNERREVLNWIPAEDITTSLSAACRPRSVKNMTDVSHAFNPSMLYRKEVSMHPSNVHVHPFFSISPLLAPVGVLSSGDDGTKFYTVYCKYISEVTDGDML